MKIERILDKKEAIALKHKIDLNDGYCLNQPKSEHTKCMCYNFIHGTDPVCKCGLYKKVDEEGDFAKVW